MPFIVSWPDGIKPGKSSALVTHTDFIASFADFFDVTIPEGAAIDSQNSMSALLGKDKKGNAYIVEEAVGYALRHGDWKFVLGTPPKGKKKKGKSWIGKKSADELYNLADDIGEQHNVLEKYPEIVERMSKILIKIKNGAGVRETVENEG